MLFDVTIDIFFIELCLNVDKLIDSCAYISHRSYITQIET